MEKNNFLILDKNYKKQIIIDKTTSNITIFDCSKLSKINLQIVIKNNGVVNINIFSFANNKKNIDIALKHATNDCKSFCSVKAIAVDNSSLKINIETIIDSNIRGYSRQEIDGMLLSNNAIIETLPILKITSDSAKAEHAVNIGRINKDFLFYLESKSIDKNKAVELILNNYFYKFQNEKTNKKILSIIKKITKEIK